MIDKQAGGGGRFERKFCSQCSHHEVSQRV
jgi:hypothetical protein